MIYIWLNAPAILAATLVALALGVVHQALQTPRHRGALGARDGLLAVLLLFWFASILAGALILAPPRAPAIAMAVGTAVVIWAGFVGPAVWLSGRYRGSRGAGRDALWWLGAMLAMTGVLSAIGLVPPPVG